MASDIEENEGWIEVDDLAGEETSSGGKYVTEEQLRDILREILGDGGSDQVELEDDELSTGLTAADVERL